MRLDRLATLYVANPIRKFSPLPDEGCLSILMYHRISDEPEEHLQPYYRVNTSPARFAEQMRFLHDERYKVVDLLHGLQLLKANAFTRKHVIITFDDGYRDFLTHAFPVLSKYRFPATVYLPTGFISDTGEDFKQTACLTWPQIRDLRKQGIRFGSHTVSHPKLRELDWTAIRRELADSRRTLETELNEPVTAFAYPYAYPETDTAFLEQFDRALAEAGYDSCVTTIIGKAMHGDNFLSLKRIPVNDCDDPALLSAKLDGAYNWLAIPQRLKKRKAQTTAP